MSVYKNQVKGMGPMVEAFGGEMIILFGDNAPDTLKDFCYTIEVLPTEKSIEEGMKINFDQSPYNIIAVGDIAERNLVNLGHLTVNFTGDQGQCLPGAIVVEQKQAPKINIGTIIEITE